MLSKLIQLHYTINWSNPIIYSNMEPDVTFDINKFIEKLDKVCYSLCLTVAHYNPQCKGEIIIHPNYLSHPLDTYMNIVCSTTHEQFINNWSHSELRSTGLRSLHDYSAYSEFTTTLVLSRIAKNTWHKLNLDYRDTITNNVLLLPLLIFINNDKQKALNSLCVSNKQLAGVLFPIWLYSSLV